MHFFKQLQSYALYKYYQLANLTMGQWESFSEPLILAELKVQCTRSNVRDNVSQYAMQELLVSKLSKKCVMGARLIDNQMRADTICKCVQCAI